MKQFRRPLAALAAAAFTLAAGAGQVAHAVPAPQITGVFRAETCGGGACEPGADNGVAKGTSLAGGIQIHVSASNDIRPIEWVRLEARYGNEPQFICLQHWVADETTFSGYFDWATPAWPDPTINSNCIHNSPHYHGKQTRNGTYQLRVVARERRVPGEGTDGHDGTSNIFSIAINNPPAPPVWVSDPSATTGSEPAVTLQWKPNAERDLREYVIIRTDPSGRERETAVSASKPRAQGCTQLGDTAIKCFDREFGKRYGGTYRYALVVRRAASAGTQRCTLGGARCIESALSEPKTVTLAGPTPGGGVQPPVTATQGPIALPTIPTNTIGQFPSLPATTPTPAATTPGIAVPAGAAQPLPRRGVLGPAGFVFALALIGWQVRRALLARR